MSSGRSKADGRTEGFSRNTRLEDLLKELNSCLWMSEREVLKGFQPSPYPLILVMGPMRSGTTLLMQWLANTGLVAYPTNLLSRFYQAPIIGAKIQLLLTDPRYNFRDELGEFLQQVEYRSENGKTQGVLAPNEFWYFWRRFLAEPSRDVWSDDELRQSMDVQTLKAELHGMMDVFHKPFAAKGLLFNYNVPFLDKLFDKVVFIQLRRDPLLNIQSVLNARVKQLGSRDAWYSFKIREYDQLLGLDPVTQVAGQVYYINRAVEAGLDGVADHRKMTVSYEDFCRKPRTVFEALAERLAEQDCVIDTGYAGADRFTAENNLRQPSAEADRARQSYQMFAEGKSPDKKG